MRQVFNLTYLRFFIEIKIYSYKIIIKVIFSTNTFSKYFNLNYCYLQFFYKYYLILILKPAFWLIYL